MGIGKAAYTEDGSRANLLKNAGFTPAFKAEQLGSRAWTSGS